MQRHAITPHVTTYSAAIGACEKDQQHRQALGDSQYAAPVVLLQSCGSCASSLHMQNNVMQSQRSAQVDQPQQLLL